MEKVVIVSMARSPFAKFNGAFQHTPLKDIASQTLHAVLNKHQLTSYVDKVIVGQVMSAGHGQNIARYASVKSGLPYSIPAMTINEVCGSGLMAIQLACQMIQLQQASCVVAGGVDSFTQTPLFQNRIDGTITDGFNDGLCDDFMNEKMGVTAENVATKYHISRQEQDYFAYHSQQKASQHKVLIEQDIIPIQTSEGIITHDECPRPTTTKEKLSTLSPVFKKEGTVTAGNSSALSDGAAFIVLMSESKAKALNLPILATIDAFCEVGIEPDIMGVAPIKAIQTLLTQTNNHLTNIDYFEINEAFASQSVAVMNELDIRDDIVNIWGGAIALGHPLGASGIRIVMQLVRILEENQKHTGIASLCIGGGMGMAIQLSR